MPEEGQKLKSDARSKTDTPKEILEKHKKLHPDCPGPVVNANVVDDGKIYYHCYAPDTDDEHKGCGMWEIVDRPAEAKKVEAKL